MQSIFAEDDLPAGFAPRALATDFADEPGIAEAYMLADALMEFLGPVFWAALIVLFVWVELKPAFGG